MKVVCIDDSYDPDNLIKGKVYEVTCPTDLTIIDNENYYLINLPSRKVLNPVLVYRRRDRFLTIEEYRQKILNNILE